eukprot:gene10298-2715_t
MSEENTEQRPAEKEEIQNGVNSNSSISKSIFAKSTPLNFDGNFGKANVEDNCEIVPDSGFNFQKNPPKMNKKFDFNFASASSSDGKNTPKNQGFPFFGSNSEQASQQKIFSSNLNSSRNSKEKSNNIFMSISSTETKTPKFDQSSSNNKKIEEKTQTEKVTEKSTENNKINDQIESSVVQNSISESQKRPVSPEEKQSPKTQNSTSKEEKEFKQPSSQIVKPSSNSRFQKPKPIVFNNKFELNRKPTIINSPSLNQKKSSSPENSIKKSNIPPQKLEKKVSPSDQQKLAVIQKLSKPASPQPEKRIREDETQLNEQKKRKISNQFEKSNIEEVLKGTKLDEDIECSMVEIKSKESEFTTTLDDIAFQMNDMTNHLREYSLDILVLSNHLLMMNDPILNEMIENLDTKYRNMLL